MSLVKTKNINFLKFTQFFNNIIEAKTIIIKLIKLTYIINKMRIELIFLKVDNDE